MKKHEKFENAKINLALNRASNAEKSVQNIQKTVQMQNEGCASKYRRANDTSNSKPDDNKKIQVPAASCDGNKNYGQVPQKINKPSEDLKNQEDSSNQKKDSSNEDKIIEVILIYADWCGYSRKAEPEFDRLLEEMDDTDYKGYILDIKKYEEKKNTPEFKEIVTDVKIRGFPTIVVRTIDTTFEDNETYTFNSIEYNDMKNKLHKVIDKNFL